jgi:hypothetical protein
MSCGSARRKSTLGPDAMIIGGWIVVWFVMRQIA